MTRRDGSGKGCAPSSSFPGSGRGASRLIASLLLLVCGAAGPAEDKARPLLWNARADKQNCPLSSDAVWVDYARGQDCIRYFSGGDVERAPVAIVIFHGDRSGLIGRRPEDIHGNTAREQEAIAERTAQRVGLPVLVVARPGTYGSSGNHFRRRQPSEFLALNAALDEIRARYRIGWFVLLGHSGGATAAAALLTMGRRDIVCAVLTSGAFSLLERARIVSEEEGRAVQPGLDLTGLPSPYDPLDHVEGIVRDPARMVLVIGNEKDRVTPFPLQKKFADALRRQGHRVRLIDHAALAPDYHDLKDSIGLAMAARCARGGA
ncbi:hypothetical protein [Sphingobium aquiterrae]|uniref:hypothetical protein n=1 Tax=Sphingobium aquiterrae TaxID=2038656 RepID=UPI00301B3569